MSVANRGEVGERSESGQPEIQRLEAYVTHRLEGNATSKLTATLGGGGKPYPSKMSRAGR